MSLPRPWIDHLFKKLSLAYGHAFLAQYKELDPDEVRDEWSQLLSHYAHHPKALAYALDNLPADKPVNALQFRNLCRQAPLPEVPQLPTPDVDPKALASSLERLKALAEKLRNRQPDPMSIVESLQKKLLNCEPLSVAQRDWLRSWYATHPKEPADPAHQ